jgi:hypothetical protein
MVKILVDNFLLPIFVRVILPETRKIEKILHGSDSVRRVDFGTLAIFQRKSAVDLVALVLLIKCLDYGYVLTTMVFWLQRVSLTDCSPHNDWPVPHPLGASLFSSALSPK